MSALTLVSGLRFTGRRSSDGCRSAPCGIPAEPNVEDGQRAGVGAVNEAGHVEAAPTPVDAQTVRTDVAAWTRRDFADQLERGRRQTHESPVVEVGDDKVAVVQTGHVTRKVQLSGAGAALTAVADDRLSV